MNTDPLGKRDDAISFLVNHDTGVLATVASDGKPSARLVYYTCDDSFNVFFITLKNTRKVVQMGADKRAAFVVSETEIPRTLQMEGTVADLTDTATVDPLLVDFSRRLMSHARYGIPISHFDASELRFFKFTPTWVRWGDFTSGEGTDTVLTMIDPADEEA